MRAFFGVQLENKIVVENLIFEANKKWGYITTNVSEMPDFNLFGIFNLRKNILQEIKQ